jgi:hypothetical protein
MSAAVEQIGVGSIVFVSFHHAIHPDITFRMIVRSIVLGIYRSFLLIRWRITTSNRRRQLRSKHGCRYFSKVIHLDLENFICSPLAVLIASTADS